MGMGRQIDKCLHKGQTFFTSLVNKESEIVCPFLFSFTVLILLPLYTNWINTGVFIGACGMLTHTYQSIYVVPSK